MSVEIPESVDYNFSRWIFDRTSTVSTALVEWDCSQRSIFTEILMFFPVKIIVANDIYFNPLATIHTIASHSTAICKHGLVKDFYDDITDFEFIHENSLENTMAVGIYYHDKLKTLIIISNRTDLKLVDVFVGPEYLDLPSRYFYCTQKYMIPEKFEEYEDMDILTYEYYREGDPLDLPIIVKFA